MIQNKRPSERLFSDGLLLRQISLAWAIPYADGCQYRTNQKDDTG